MDRGAWWATVHGVAKNQTRLSDFHTSHVKKCHETSLSKSLQCLFLISDRKEAKWAGKHSLNLSGSSETHHGRQGGVQTGFRLAVISIAVLITAAVVDKANLQVHPTLQAGQKHTEHSFHSAICYPAASKNSGFARESSLMCSSQGAVSDQYYARFINSNFY